MVELALTASGATVRGRRVNNEDALGQREPSDSAGRASHGSLYVVADGMGGRRAGEVASHLAVETLLDAYYGGPDGGGPALCTAIDTANRRIREAAATCQEWAGMGSTIVACLVRGADATIAHVGDSRAYLVRDGVARVLTQDHLYVTDVLGLDEEAAWRSGQRHVLSRALGGDRVARPDVAPLHLVSGDRVVLCTDGVSNVVRADEIAAIAEGRPPHSAVQRLLALARMRRTADNASALMIAVAAEEGNEARRPA